MPSCQPAKFYLLSLGLHIITSAENIGGHVHAFYRLTLLQ